MNNLGDIWVKIGADVSEFNQALGSVGKFIGVAFAVDTLIDFQKKIISVTSEFERYEAVLSNTLGSSRKAQIALNSITEIASKTPFAVDKLTDSFVRLANQGFVPTMEEMVKLGDLSSSVGKDITQLSEAIIDAQVGEFERLKEFGIRAKKDGDLVTFTFKGIETQVQNTSESIREYLIGLGEVQGVSGSMAKISETLGGKLSNLDDNFTNLFKTLGEAESGILKSLVDGLNYFIQNLTTTIKGIEQIREELEMANFDTKMNSAFESVVDLVKRYEEILTDNSVEENIDKATKDIIESYRKLFLAGKMTAMDFANLKDELQKYGEKLKEGNRGQEESLGLIESITQQIETLNEQREKASSISEITKLDAEIERLEDKLDLIDAISRRRRQTELPIPEIEAREMPSMEIEAPKLTLQIPDGLIESYEKALEKLRSEQKEEVNVTRIAELNEEIALLEEKLLILNNIRLAEGEDGEMGFTLDSEGMAEKSQNMIESLRGILDETDAVALAFDGLADSIINGMEFSSNALKAFMNVLVASTGRYLQEAIKINSADKIKATGRVFNVALQTAEGAGPLGAIVFPAILAGLMGLLSQAFRGGASVSGGGGGGFVGSAPEATSLVGNQLENSIDNSLGITGSMEVDGDKLMIYFKNRDDINARS